MINDALDRKAARGSLAKGHGRCRSPARGRVLAMIFEKNSTRTRGQLRHGDAPAWRHFAMVMDAASTQLGRGESIADTARVLSRMVDAIMIRTDDHAKARKWRAMPRCR
jgi:ornithine carbamoyltransferase